MYCGKCGAPFADGAENCPNCGAPASSENSGNSLRHPNPTIRFAGFWLRAVALIVDSVILTLVSLPILFRPLMQNVGPNITFKSYAEFLGSGTRQAIAFELLAQLCFWLYCAAFESSVWQATPGKKMLGIFVTDLQGKRISFARATGRHAGKTFENLTLFIGFLMAGFTRKKQALHDMIAGTLVLKKI